MRQALQQSHQQEQVHQQSLIQAMKLLALDAEELEAELGAEQERNPALGIKPASSSGPLPKSGSEQGQTAKGGEGEPLLDALQAGLGSPPFRPGQAGDTNTKMEAMENTPGRQAAFQEQLYLQYAQEESDTRRRRMANYLLNSMDASGYLRQPLAEVAKNMNEVTEEGVLQAVANLLFLLRAEGEPPTGWPSLKASFATRLGEMGLEPEDVPSVLAILERLHARGVDFQATAERALAAGPAQPGSPALDVRREVLLKHLRDVAQNRLGKVIDALLHQVLAWDSRLRTAIVARLRQASQVEVARRMAEQADGAVSPCDETELERLGAEAQRAFAEAMREPELADAVAGISWALEELLFADSAKGKNETKEAEDDFRQNSEVANRITPEEAARLLDLYYPAEKVFIAKDGSMLPPRRWGLGEALEPNEHGKVKQEPKDPSPVRNLRKKLRAALKSLRKGVLAEMDRGGRLAAAVEEVLATARATPEELGVVLHQLRSLCPGIGARTLCECLLLQLDVEDPDFELHRRLIEEHLPDIEKNRLPQISAALGVEITKVKALIAELQELAPRPANAYESDRAPTERLDFEVKLIEGRYEVSSLHSICARLGLSKYRSPSRKTEEANDPQSILVRRKREEEYKKCLAGGFVKRLREKGKVTGPDRQLMREQLRSAKTFLNTLVTCEMLRDKIVRHVIEVQEEFFEKGMDGLKALTMTEVARQIGIDPATVSRAVRGRYIGTPRGTFELRYFFSEGVPSTRGPEAFSSETLDNWLLELIESEPKRKPWTDRLICQMLEERHHCKVSRRTIAERREKMGIRKASQRREF